MSGKRLIRIKSISEFHRLRGLPKPEHPLISVLDYSTIPHAPESDGANWTFDFYSIAVKRGLNGKFYYGQEQYDFDEGVMFFMSPNQIFGTEAASGLPADRSGWLLLFHPDFLWGTSLAKNIKEYEFFDYAINEALFLSDREEGTINDIIRAIKQEYHSNIDRFSQQIIISQLETLLNYSERFYERQFITRKTSGNHLLSRLEELLNRYFSDNQLQESGVPTVQVISEALNISPGYLSRLLKSLTGQTTQQHIHNKMVEKAKEKLSVTDLSVSEIAYSLGFEHPQSLNKLFKTKTNQSPLEFRNSFNL
jgi:AraC family transcriptional regulator, transcriptional activator of pobA